MRKEDGGRERETNGTKRKKNREKLRPIVKLLRFIDQKATISSIKRDSG